MSANLTFHDAQIQHFLKSPTGDVARQVLRRAELVAERARQNVERQFTQRTGALRDSIGVETRPGPEGLDAEVVSTLRTRDGRFSVGTLMEIGTEGHDIFASNAEFLISEPGHPDPIPSDDMAVVPGYPFLVKNVNHPGTPARPWLVPALESVFH